MPDSEDARRRELVAHHRRSSTTGALLGAALSPLLLTWRGRRARASNDPWAWAAIAAIAVSALLNWLANNRRAEWAAERDLALEAQVRANRQRLERGEPITRSPLSPGQTTIGCLTQAGVLAAGVVQALWDYRQRPDAGRRVEGPRWRLRPAPAWWTAWSFQQLPVNATSTAPREHQIAYERRQIVTLRTTGIVSTAIGTWQTQLRRAVGERDRLMLAAGTAKIAGNVARAVADYRGVPVKVDAQRARRRRHDAAIAALVAARATGLPGPGNPWRGDMLLAASTGAAVALGSTAMWRTVRRKPKPRAAGGPDIASNT